MFSSTCMAPLFASLGICIFLLSLVRNVVNVPTYNESCKGSPAVLLRGLIWTFCSVCSRVLAGDSLQKVQRLSLGHLRSHIQPLRTGADVISYCWSLDINAFKYVIIKYFNAINATLFFVR